MKRAAQLICLAAVCCLATFLMLGGWSHHLLHAYSVNWNNILAYDDWHLVVNATTNAYHPWRFDHLLLALDGPFKPSNTLHALFLTSCVVFTCGNILLLSWIEGERSLINATIISIVLTCLLTALYGEDIVIFQTIAWLPWLIVATAHALCTKGTKLAQMAAIILVAFFAQSMAGSANQLSLVCSVAVGIISFRLATAQGGIKTPPVITLLVGLALIIPSVVCIAHCPAPVWPDYPPLAHVVPDDGIPGTIQSLVGPEAPIQTIDRIVVKQVFGRLAISLLALVFIALLLSGAHKSRLSKDLLLGAGALIVALAWDTVLPEGLAQLGPLGSMTRMMPHVIFVSLVPLCTALAIISLATQFAVAQRTILGSCILLILIFPPFSHPIDKNLLSGALLLRDAPFLTKEPGPSMDLVVSPSYALGSRGGWKRENNENAVFKPISKDVKISKLDGTSDPSLRLTSDGQANTRWSPGGGKQLGTEGFKIQFPSIISLRGIELSTGDYNSDFPGGIELSTCANEQSAQQIITTYPSWQGSIYFTPGGYPYYGGQSEVKIVLSHPQQLSCLQIKQIGIRHRFDWSVAEINIATE